MPPPWYRDGDAFTTVYCRHGDCNRVVRLTASAVPYTCPGCARKTKDGGDWWTIVRPSSKPMKGTLTDKDRDFLRCQRIEPWEGGIDTE